MNYLAFISQEWLLIATLIVLIYLYVWRERVKSGQPLSPHQVTQLVNQGDTLLVDLREAAEFKSGHIVGSVNMPYSKLVSNTAELSGHSSKTIILVDKLGQHAGTIGRKLGKEGFNVRRLGGGITEWQGQNLPLVKGK